MTHAEPHSLWLPEFCAGRPSHYFEVAKQPWTLTREGKPFTVATTGLAIREFLKPLLTEEQLRVASGKIAGYVGTAVRLDRQTRPDPLANLADVILNGRRAR